MPATGSCLSSPRLRVLEWAVECGAETCLFHKVKTEALRRDREPLPLHYSMSPPRASFWLGGRWMSDNGQPHMD